MSEEQVGALPPSSAALSPSGLSRCASQAKPPAANAEWREALAATKPGRYIAVVDRPLLCSWHFATFDGTDWFDLSSGRQIPITHWMPFPAGPSGSRP